MMAIHQASPRAWTAAEVAMVEAVVEPVASHIERIRDAASAAEQQRLLRAITDNASVALFIMGEQWEIFKLAFLTSSRVAVLSDQDGDGWMYDYRFLKAVR